MTDAPLRGVCLYCGGADFHGMGECMARVTGQRDLLLAVVRLALTGKRSSWYPKGLREEARKAIDALPSSFHPVDELALRKKRR